MTRNKIKIIAILLYCSILPLLASSCNETPTPTCNAEDVWWPTEVIVPPVWGTPCESAWLELPTPIQVSVQSAYTVYGRVTIYETIPLPGAEIRVNRIVDGAQSGAGMAISDAAGEWRIEAAGEADALRIYIIYPPQYVAWGVTSHGIPRSLDVIHWASPPASCGPIYWKAAYRYTPTATVTSTPSRTPTQTLRPTRTATASITPTATQTRTPTVTPMATEYAVSLPGLLRMTPADTHLELHQQQIIIGVRGLNMMAGVIGAAMVAGAAMGLWSIKRRE